MRSCGDGKHTQNGTQSPDKGLAINGCLQSAAPPLVPPVTVVQANKCLTLSKNPQATANSAPPSTVCTVYTMDNGNRQDQDCCQPKPDIFLLSLVHSKQTQAEQLIKSIRNTPSLFYH